MARLALPIRPWLDRAGVALSAMCAVHCVSTVLLVSALGLGGELLLDPAIHRLGLSVAALIAAVAIGWGAVKHRMAGPFVVAMTGLTFMGGALAAPHGTEEAVLTIIGVALVALGHGLNLRHLHGPCRHGAERWPAARARKAP